MSSSSSSSSSSPRSSPSARGPPLETTTSAAIEVQETPPSNPAKVKSAIQSLSSILSTIPTSLSSSPNPAFTLLHDPDVYSQISALLRHPSSGAGDNNLCRWLYDTFQSTDPSLQLVVLHFVPIIAGVYLSRVPFCKTLAGFEAVLLALYAHETTSRDGQSLTVNIPDLSHPSIYHDSKPPAKSNATDFNLAVISASLEPHGTVRSTRRARIVGVALELYYNKIYQMPTNSKIDFCEFCKIWAGQNGEIYKDDKHKEEEKKPKEGRVPLPWELLQPVLRIVGHCLLGPRSARERELFEAASAAVNSLYERALHDLDAKGILATESLLKLGKMALDPTYNIDHTEIPVTNVISL